MRNVVWKYPVKFGVQGITIPRSAVILHVAPQGGDLMMWTQVNPDDPVSSDRGLAVVGTGHIFEGVAVPINTFLMDGGSLVFHAFELLQ